MAGAKETPRQKMIGMMYLVLTAMLALNVSVEVLDAFTMVDKGLDKSVVTIREKNITEISRFVAMAADNYEKVIPWKNKADEVHKRAGELHDYIHELKVKIVKATDGEEAEAIKEDGSIDGEAISGKSDTDAGTRVMLGVDGSGEAYVLRKKIDEYKALLLSHVDENSPIAKSIKNLLPTENPPALADGTNRTWETSQFESTPVAAIVAVLSMLQLNVANCESEALTYLLNQINASDYKFSDIEVAVIPSSNYVIKGTEYSADIFLAAYDPTLRPTLRIGGRTLSADDKGIVTYKVQPQTVGPMSIRGEIEFPSPGGGMTTLPVHLQFQVAEPQVVVSPTKMNVVYRGIENPLSISLSGVAPERLVPSVSTGTITRRGNEFILVPGAGNTCVVSVAMDGKSMGGFTFRVKNLPVPTPVIHGVTSKTVSKGELLAAQGLRAEMRDFEFDLQYRVTSFVLSVTIDGYLEEARSDSQVLTEQQRQILNRVKAGQRVAFTDIKAIGPDGRTVDLLDLSVRVK